MAVELVLGAGLGLAFTVLYDGVKKGIDKFKEFKPLLGALRSTLESIQPLVIEQIGELNVKLDLPNHEKQQLEEQMWRGEKIIVKLSKVHWWNLKKSRYTDELLELDGSLKKLLKQLQMQQARDVKENLMVAKKTAQQLVQFQERAEELANELIEKETDFQQKLLLAMEDNGKQVHGLQALIEKMMNQNESMDTSTDASTGGYFEELKILFETLIRDLRILSAENIPYKSVIQSTSVNVRTVYDELKEIKEKNPHLLEDGGRMKDRLEYLKIDLQEGVKLIANSSKLSTWNVFEKFTYTNKLFRWGASIGAFMIDARFYARFYDTQEVEGALKWKQVDLFTIQQLHTV